MISYYKKYIKYKTKYLNYKTKNTNYEDDNNIINEKINEKITGGEFNKKLQTKIKNEIYANKSSKKNPTFFITYGPPASGKGSIMEKVIVEENKNISVIKEKKSDKQIVKVDIDSIVIQHPKFKKNRDDLLKDKMVLLTKKTNHSKVKDKIEEINKKLQDLYMKYRKNAPKNTLKGDDLSDNITEEALERRLDIAWETTGFSIDWTIENTIPMVKQANYKIVVVYPLVPVTIANARAREREKTTGQTPAPNIKEIAKNAANNIKKLKKMVDAIYIYDNSGKKGEEQLLIKYETKKVESVKCLTSNAKSNAKSKFIREVQSMIQDFCK